MFIVLVFQEVHSTTNKYQWLANLKIPRYAISSQLNEQEAKWSINILFFDLTILIIHGEEKVELLFIVACGQ